MATNPQPVQGRDAQNAAVQDGQGGRGAVPLITPFEVVNPSLVGAAYMKNLIVDVRPDGTGRLRQRPSLAAPFFTAPSGTPRGCYTWASVIYSIFGGILYKDGVATGVVSDSGMYHFQNTVGTTARLVFTNGVNHYVCNTSGTVSAITPVQLIAPNLMAQGIAYVDGTIYMLRKDGRIYGSDINDPTVWNTTNFITAEIESDEGVALSKQRLYISVFKERSTEFFYNAANPLGSPLARSESNKLDVGIAAATTLQEVEGLLFWMSVSSSGSRAVHLLEGLSPQQISTMSIERLLQVIDIANVTSWGGRIAGQLLYGINCNTEGYTLVYSQRSQQWSVWTTAADTALPWVQTCVSSAGQLVVQAAQSLYLASNELAADASDPRFTVEVHTGIFDADTLQRKTIGSVELLGWPVGTFELSFTDSTQEDDWTVAGDLDLESPRAKLSRLGTFVVRRFRLRGLAKEGMALDRMPITLNIAPN